MARYGITLPLPHISLPEHRSVLEEVASLGYTDVWTGEVAGADAFTPLVLAAAWAPAELRLGTAIVPVHTRGPAVIAQTAAALAELAPGRVVLGIGSSGRAPVTAMNGIPFDEPYKKTRDVLRYLKQLYETGSVAGEFDTFTIEGFQLARPVSHPPQVILGALRPRMLRLGFREGDGAITNFLAATDIPAVVSALGEHRREGELVCRIFVYPTRDSDYARHAGRQFLTYLFTRPQYRAFHEWLGRRSLVETVNKLVDAGDLSGASRAIPDEVVDGIFPHGNPEQIRAAVQAYVDAGVDTPVLMIQPVPEMADGLPALRKIVAELAP